MQLTNIQDKKEAISECVHKLVHCVVQIEQYRENLSWTSKFLARHLRNWDQPC